MDKILSFFLLSLCFFSLICKLPETEVEDEFFLPDSLARRVECWDFQLAPETEASGPLMKLAKVRFLYPGFLLGVQLKKGG